MNGSRTPFAVGDLPPRAVMGVVNVTPDSFSDGGRFLDARVAAAHAVALAADGAAVVDIGGESTRPGAEPVVDADELARVLPVIEAINATSPVLVSVDTTKPSVARAALARGAAIVNDVSGGGDPELLAALVREAKGVTM